jgi:small subunit ribosomal protein S16
MLFQNFKYSLRSNMIKIRLQRHGARHAPFYRMVVTPSETRRDGRYIEVLGTYNPQSSARERELDLKLDRIDHWLDVGAQPTDTARSLIRQGRLSPEEWLKRTEAKAAARAARTSKKKNPAPAAEAAAPAEEEAKPEVAPAGDIKDEPAKEEPKAVEAPAEEVKDEPKAEKPDADAKESPKEPAKEKPKAEKVPAKEVEEEAKKEAEEKPKAKKDESKKKPEDTPSAEAKEESKDS